MKIKLVIWTMFMCVAGVAHANNFNTDCNYSHTLPDDPIVYPGKAGEAMVHDFFGNSSTNASSTYDSLSSNKVITCDSNADRSAYWAPQLKRPSGIVSPKYEKTYYKDDQHVASFPINAIPLGLQMLAGNHMGTAPNPHVNFLCRGSGNYTSTMPASCPPNPNSDGDPSQLDISVHFPDCWDGVNLVPNLGSGRKNRMKGLMKAADGALNVAYRNSDGTCPAGYKVKIPELQLNISYPLGADPDLTTAQLSLDPILQNGQWVPQWGSMYTAHGDFFNAWHAESMQYIVDSCMNKPTTAGSTCSKNIPVYYSAASANARLTSTGSIETSGATLVSAPNDVIFIKFPTPANLNDYAYVGSFLQNAGWQCDRYRRSVPLLICRLDGLGRRSPPADGRGVRRDWLHWQVLCGQRAAGANHRHQCVCRGTKTSWSEGNRPLHSQHDNQDLPVFLAPGIVDARAISEVMA